MKKEQITELGNIFNKLSSLFSADKEKEEKEPTSTEEELKEDDKPKEDDEKDKEIKQEFKTASLKDSEQVVEYDSLEVGKVLKDENGDTMADGEYIVDVSEADQEKKYKKVVVKDGIIDNVEDFEETKEDVPVDDVKMAEEEKASKETELQIIAKTLGIDLSVDGWHSIDFSVSDGVIMWGELMSESYKTLMSKQEKEISEQNTKIEKFAKENKDLKEKIDILGKSSNEKEPQKQEFSKDTQNSTTVPNYMYYTGN